MYLYTYTLDIRQHKTELDVSEPGLHEMEASDDYRLRDAAESGHRANMPITWAFHYTHTDHTTTHRHMHDPQPPAHDCRPLYGTDFDWGQSICKQYSMKEI